MGASGFRLLWVGIERIVVMRRLATISAMAAMLALVIPPTAVAAEQVRGEEQQVYVTYADGPEVISVGFGHWKEINPWYDEDVFYINLWACDFIQEQCWEDTGVVKDVKYSFTPVHASLSANVEMRCVFNNCDTTFKWVQLESTFNATPPTTPQVTPTSGGVSISWEPTVESVTFSVSPEIIPGMATPPMRGTPHFTMYRYHDVYR